MGFTTQTFIFVFFPLCIFGCFFIEQLEKLGWIGRFIIRLRGKDLFIIVCSLVFYAWAFVKDLSFLVIFILMVYLSSMLICWIKKGNRHLKSYKDTQEGSKTECRRFYLVSIPFALILLGFLLCLIHYKYMDFLNDIWLSLFNKQLSTQSVLAPLGISFLTFSAISYLADIYREKATPGSLVDCALYLTFFPKLISGPIILWKDFQKQMTVRRMSMDFSIDGINQIMIGFAQKVLLADLFGQTLTQIGTENVDQITAIGTVLLYFLQIYYDFAGYSHIAIGLAKIMGFSFSPNFNFPYRSTSISEFWRRWHISLGSWFREYVYFPLGGSRVSKAKTLRNLAIVFALTGIWHGAGWTYILWGTINAVAVVFECSMQDNAIYKRIPKFIKYLVTMTIVVLFWQLFRFPKMEMVVDWFKIMSGSISFDSVICTWRYYFDARLITAVVVGLLGATVFGSPKIIGAYQKMVTKPAFYVLQEVALMGVFILALVFMVNSTYSPFIYFQY